MNRKDEILDQVEWTDHDLSELMEEDIPLYPDQDPDLEQEQEEELQIESGDQDLISTQKTRKATLYRQVSLSTRDLENRWIQDDVGENEEILSLSHRQLLKLRIFIWAYVIIVSGFVLWLTAYVGNLSCLCLLFFSAIMIPYLVRLEIRAWRLRSWKQKKELQEQQSQHDTGKFEK